MKPEVGKLLVFPSWLQHMVYPFQREMGKEELLLLTLIAWDVTEQPTETGEKNGNVN